MVKIKKSVALSVLRKEYLKSLKYYIFLIKHSFFLFMISVVLKMKNI